MSVNFSQNNEKVQLSNEYEFLKGFFAGDDELVSFVLKSFVCCIKDFSSTKRHCTSNVMFI